MAGSGGRARRRKAINEQTKAKSAEATKQYWDELGQGEKVTAGDIAYQAAGAIPFVGGALAAKDLARGALGAGSAIGASGDALEVAGKAGLKSAGQGALAAAGTVAGVVGAADALAGAAKLYNKMSYQNMTPEEQEARRTQTASTRRGSRRSPVERNSPLKQYSASFVDQINRGRVNYATLSDEIGGSVEEAIAQNRERADREAEQARQAQLDEMRQLQLASIKQNQYESLQIAGDTGVPSFDQHLQSASRMLVDKQAGLVNQLKNGEINTDDFAVASAQIKGEIPNLKATKQALSTFQTNYQGLLEADELSGANDGQAGMLYNCLLYTSPSPRDRTRSRMPSSA